MVLGTVVAMVAAFTSLAGAAVWTDQPDYTPGSVVTISGDNSNGAGYVAGNEVDVAASADNGLWSDTCTATVAEGSTWSCQVTLSSDPTVAVGSYSYTATSVDADGNQIVESGTFTDTQPVQIEAATAATYTYNGSTCGSASTSFYLGQTVCAKSVVTTNGSTTGSETLYFVWFKGTTLKVAHNVSVTSAGTYSDTYVPDATGTDWSVKTCKQDDCTPANKVWETSAPFTVAKSPTHMDLSISPQLVFVGNSATATARLSSPVSSCVTSKSVAFTVDPDPGTGTDLGSSTTAATATSGGYYTGGYYANATKVISTTGWDPGVYEVTATFSATATCLGSSDDATLTVASPGDSATGGGWESYNGRLNFGFTVSQVPHSNPVQYRGSFLLINNGKWKVKGALTTYGTANGTGYASGTGRLYEWDSETATWAFVGDGTAVNLAFYDAGTPSGKKGASTKLDTFGVQVAGTDLDNYGNPYQLKGGDISIK